MERKNDAASAVTALCTECGLCCNGVLFADVRLQAGDDPARLNALGVALKAGKSGARFRQPCACLHAGRCTIYSDRPNRCRTFECRVLQRTLTGELSERNAVKTIRAARAQAEKVRAILRALGDDAETVPLNRRYGRMMRQPIDLGGDRRVVKLRGELMRAVAELAHALEAEFLS